MNTELEYLIVETLSCPSTKGIKKKFFISSDAIVCEEKITNLRSLDSMSENQIEMIRHANTQEERSRLMDDILAVSRKRCIKTTGIEQWLSNLKNTGFEEWEKEPYTDINLVDGFDWHIQYKYRDCEPSRRYGGDIYPKGWDVFVQVLNRVERVIKEEEAQIRNEK